MLITSERQALIEAILAQERLLILFETTNIVDPSDRAFLELFSTRDLHAMHERFIGGVHQAIRLIKERETSGFQQVSDLPSSLQ